MVPSLLLFLSISSSLACRGASPHREATNYDARDQAPNPAYWSWAKTPPMGWNSWDGFATTVTEAQTRAHIDVMADKLRRYGWQYIVVDIQWYEPNATGFDYRKGAKLEMDGFGRLIPAVNKFPSSARGVGFRALADYAHHRGLKFGVHLMRGIPRQAVEAKMPIKGTPYTAADVADVNSVCPWNSDMYGVDLSKPGAQAYYDSVFYQFAEWHLDFVKVDDLSRPYHTLEVEAIRKAIDKTGRHMVFSTSPGATPLDAGPNVIKEANMWRISDDFWDNWESLLAQFDRLRAWTPYRGPGHFPDADMLSLGVIQMGRAKTRFNPNEQQTLITLWSISRSPLILGADLTKLDDFTLSLITNPEVIAVDQASENNRELFKRGAIRAWIADVPNSKDKYLALFNTDTTASVTVDLSELGLGQTVRIRDLWKRKELGPFEGNFSAEIAGHGAGLYRITPAKT
jgi:alpha-galactosidase